MSRRVTGKPPTSTWRRPITRMYDYNMQLGENYYKPQLDYISTRKGRGKTPPSATTFAERLLQNRSSSATRRAEESDFTVGSSLSASAGRDEASLGRYASLDDLGLDDEFTTRRRRLLLQASQENLAGSDRGVSPAVSSSSRHRVTFGDKVLDAVGVKEVSGGSASKSLMTSEEGDVIDKILSERRNRRQQGLTIQSAEADLFTEDPLKSPRISSRLQQARQQMDDMREEMKREADANTTTSRFRQRLRAKREQERKEDEQGLLFGSLSALNDTTSGMNSSSAMSSRRTAAAAATTNSTASSTSATSGSSKLKLISNVSSSAQNLTSFVDDDDAETNAILDKVEQIRKRAKARLAAISDDFPDLQIESSLASRRADSRARQAAFLEDDDFDSDLMSSSRLARSSAAAAASSASGGGSSRSVTISKRAIKSSYDLE